MRKIAPRSLRVRPVAWLIVGGGLAATTVTACGDSGTTGTGGSATTSSNASTSSGAQGKIDCPTAPKVAGCSIAIGPTDKAYDALQAAFLDAKAMETICLCPGNFSFDRNTSLSTQNVTVRGAGATPDDTVLDFAKQSAGLEQGGIGVTANGFDIENLTVKNSPGNGVVVTGATGVTFKDMKVSWDAGSSQANGAYAVYPVRSTNVLIDNLEVTGASDAGIYVGQCTNAIVRNSKVHGCVAGIESENTTDMEVYGNEAYDNTAGILVFVLPHLAKMDGLRTNVHDNNIHDNNHENFAVAGSVVSNVPVGIGMLVLAADSPELHGNTIANNDSVGITVVSGKTYEILSGTKWNDPATDYYPNNVFIHDNTFTNNGTKPHAPLDGFTPPLENVLFDGEEMSPGSDKLCLGAAGPWPTFRDAEGSLNIGNPQNQSTDSTPFHCDGTALTPISL